tara:strand:- start:309 stop:701 length:393 start_codon:yes stop_codon:yes gene_type:complete
MTERNSPGNSGLLESLSLLAGTLATIVHTRLELVSVELQEEVARSVSRLVATLVALWCLGIGVVLATILLVAAFWDTHRLVALGVCAGIFLFVGLVLWVFTLRNEKAKPKLFAASLMALSKDSEQLGSRQ